MAWTDATTVHCCPSLVPQVGGWIAGEILKLSDVRGRAYVVKHFIKVAAVCVECVRGLGVRGIPHT